MQQHDDIKKILFIGILLASMSINQLYALPDLLNPKKLFSKNKTASTALPSANLEFSREGNRLYIYILIQQEQDTLGSVKVIWKSPETSVCGDSQYSLKYSGLKYKTKAYRTVTADTQDGDPLTCSGPWKVSLVTTDGQVITTGIFNVKDENALDQVIGSNANITDPAYDVEDTGSSPG